ncbi:MAG TPA: hypothetical protein VFV94_03390 [Polyangiaceae bacterium]|nr:hypothetical protein [Polyangiaceae bacterium]
MLRDSLFGERIVWASRPAVIRPSAFQRSLAVVAFVASFITLCFSLLVAILLHGEFLPLLFFAFWCATLGLGILQVPRLILSQARYVVTDQHVIAIYGPIRRTIERRAISFARIYWDESQPDAGDVELVRAVPTGALKRRLMLRLIGVKAPDRVWAIVRGAERLAPRGGADQPLTQRLDVGEHVVWSAQPRQALKRFVPRGQREWTLLAIALALFVGGGRVALGGIHALRRVHEDGGMPLRSLPFAILAFGVASTILLLLGIACYLVYDAIIRSGYLASYTRYLVTNKRVLIQRRGEELHLDRQKIYDVIEAPKGDGLHDVFLVLDGPRARAVAASGAFGELARGPHLRPVFEAVEDAEGVSRILRARPEMPHAA